VVRQRIRGGPAVPRRRVTRSRVSQHQLRSSSDRSTQVHRAWESEAPQVARRRRARRPRAEKSRGRSSLGWDAGPKPPARQMAQALGDHELDHSGPLEGSRPASRAFGDAPDLRRTSCQRTAASTDHQRTPPRGRESVRLTRGSRRGTSLGQPMAPPTGQGSSAMVARPRHSDLRVVIVRGPDGSDCRHRPGERGQPA